MTPTQEHLFKLVCEIDDICRKYDIEFFIEYGTMLGAVRHGGFIPWDNDLDIAMTEENYDKFVVACEKELDHKTRTFGDNRRDRSFPQVFGHYIDLTTCRQSKRNNYWKHYNGQWIDVFCMLELPGDEWKRQEAIDRYFAYDEFVNENFRHYRWKSDAIMKNLRDYEERSRQVGKEKVLQELEKEIFGHRYDDCDTYMIASARAGSPTPFVPKSAYEKPRRVMYEGHEFSIPGDYVEILTLYYGDNFNLYPKDPDMHTEMSHSPVLGDAYVDDFIRIVDVDEMLKVRKRSKESLVEEGYRMAKINEKFLRAEGLKVKWDLDRQIKEEKIDVNGIIENGTIDDLAVLDKLFSTYFVKQFHAQTRYARVHFDIGEDLEYAALYTMLFYRNKGVMVDHMFTLRSRNHIPMTPRLQPLKEAVQRIRNIKKYIYYEEYEAAKENLDWCLEHLPKCREIQMGEIKYLAATAESAEEIDRTLRLADELLERYPNDDICRKAKGDMYWKLGQREQAKAVYQELKDTSNDGFILLDISRREGGTER